MRLESDKCKLFQNLRECGQVSDRSIVLVVVDFEPRLLQIIIFNEALLQLVDVTYIIEKNFSLSHC